MSQEGVTSMYEKINPLYDRVLVKKVDLTQEETEGGIIMPDTGKEKAQTGQVIAVGHGRLLSHGELKPLQVQNGDMVFFGKYAGTEAGDEYLILKEDEILGTIQQ